MAPEGDIDDFFDAAAQGSGGGSDGGRRGAAVDHAVGGFGLRGVGLKMNQLGQTAAFSFGFHLPSCHCGFHFCEPQPE